MANNFVKRVAFYIQRHSYNIHLRKAEHNVLKFFLPKGKFHEGINSLKILKNDKEVFTELENDGLSDLGITISGSQIDSIVSQLEKINCYNIEKPEKPIVDLKSVEKDVQLAHYKRGDLSMIPQIIEIANDSKILNVVTRYFGAQPTISNINCWWSFGDRETAKNAQFYHRDLDDFRFLKMFIYLTDVNEDNGPHIYVKGSHKSNKLKQLRRFSDAEVNELFTRFNILTLTKPRGTTFIEDTYGIHKGQLPLKGKRLILQVQYSYFPLHVENYQPQKSNIFKTMHIDKYSNRLLFTE
jgi:hypothetical protein